MPENIGSYRPFGAIGIGRVVAMVGVALSGVFLAAPTAHATFLAQASASASTLGGGSDSDSVMSTVNPVALASAMAGGLAADDQAASAGSSFPGAATASAGTSANASESFARGSAGSSFSFSQTLVLQGAPGPVSVAFGYAATASGGADVESGVHIEDAASGGASVSFVLNLNNVLLVLERGSMGRIADRNGDVQEFMSGMDIVGGAVGFVTFNMDVGQTISFTASGNATAESSTGPVLEDVAGAAASGNGRAAVVWGFSILDLVPPAASLLTTASFAVGPAMDGPRLVDPDNPDFVVPSAFDATLENARLALPDNPLAVPVPGSLILMVSIGIILSIQNKYKIIGHKNKI